MSPARRSTNGAGASAGSSPARGTGSSSHDAALPRPEYEVLYNSAVQSFVRRDHAKTQVTLRKLLDLVRALPRDRTPWYNLGPSVGTGAAGSTALTATAAAAETGLSGDEWMTKTLKLVISANASLYSDPPRSFTAMQHLLPPSPPSAMLEHIHSLCVETYGESLLPPQLLSTLLLAALKLRPTESALAFAHALAEDWLAKLPDAFVLAIASDARGQNRKRVEVAREGYLKVVELFVGEVLAREGEWEMARGLLEGEMVMGSKKKEALYRHLRALQSKPPPSVASSPASSGILPSPAPTPGHNGRSRASTTSTSSSEGTARPAGGPVGTTQRAVKGKARGGAESESVGESTIQAASHASEATAVPTKITVNHPDSGPSRTHGGHGGHGHGHHGGNTPPAGVVRAALALLPISVQTRLDELYRSGWLMPALLPIPVAAVLFIVHRRRRRLGRGDVDDVRDRLRRARAQGLEGLRLWVLYWVKWWAEKVAGVWKLGTTITYM